MEFNWSMKNFFSIKFCWVVAVVFTSHAALFGQEFQPQALEQIQALLNEKQQRTPTEQKVSSRLLYALKRAQGDALFQQLPQFETMAAEDNGSHVLVDIRADVSENIIALIDQLDGKVVNAHKKYHAIRASIPWTSIMTLAANTDVSFIGPAEQMMTQAINRTEGDVAHTADTGRARFGVDGTGIKVGAISDSVDALNDLLGCDLPNAVTVLPGQSGNPGTSEGTALLEIIHDMAPGAELFFATANGGTAQFAQNILDLMAAGCDVIIDDAQYFNEGVFQDGIVALAAEAFVANGGLYFTSAGNSGNFNSGNSGVWEGDYVGIALPASLNGQAISAQDFGGGVNNNQVSMDSPFFFTLQWSDPLFQSDNDYDLFLLSEDLTTVIAASTNTQNGTQQGFEIINSIGRDDTNARLVVALVNGESRHIHLNTHRGRLDVGTPGQIFGHPGAENVVTVGAVNVATAAGGPFTGGAANPIEFFSSDGPRRIFFNPDGSPVAPADASRGGQTSVVRQKPDVAAADGVMTATPGFDPFFGTSASAPHSAAISALIKEHLTNERFLEEGFEVEFITDLFSTTAFDIEDPGLDRDSGDGIMMLDPSLDNPIFADGFESGDASSWTK